MVVRKLVGPLLAALLVGGLLYEVRSLRRLPDEEPAAFRRDSLPKSAGSRRDALLLKIASAPFQLREQPDGYSWTYDGGRSLLPTMMEWVDLESRRSPSLDYSVTVFRDGGPLVLKVSGKQGVKPFLKAELGPLLRHATDISKLHKRAG